VHDEPQVFAIRSGADQALDISRKTFSECSEAVYELCEEYKSEYGLTNLKVCDTRMPEQLS
jgi:DNA mismatch repair ATPase MutS